MRLPFVSREAYDLALRQIAALQERNDRLVEAVSRQEANAPVLMPHVAQEVEPSMGWWDKKPIES